MPRYNHAVAVAFEVVSEEEQGNDLTKEKLVSALMKRLSNILTDPNEGSVFEIFDVYDSYEVEEERQLPEICAALHPTDNSPILIRRGEAGYHPWPGKTEEDVTRFNERHGISDDVIEAMLIGSIAGWGVPGAIPESWREME